MNRPTLEIPFLGPPPAKVAKAGASLQTGRQTFATFATFADTPRQNENPPGELTERTAIVSEGAGVPMGWAEDFARLEALPSPPGVSPATWLEMMNAAGRFLDQWGAKAAALGWSSAELFGLDDKSPFRRLDRRGAAFFLIRREVIGITAAEIKLRDGGNILTIRKRDGFTLPAWERSASRG